MFTAGFATDPTAAWDPYGTNAATSGGLVRDGAIYPQGGFFDEGALEPGVFAYTIPFAMPDGGRIGYKAIFCPRFNIFTGPGWGLGFRSTQTGFPTSESVTYEGLHQPTGVERSSILSECGGFAYRQDNHGLTLAGQTIWLTFDAMPDLQTFVGSMWLSPPPVSGGTPERSYTLVTAAPLSGPLYPVFEGIQVNEGPPGPPPAVDNTHYDDWFATGHAVPPVLTPWPYPDPSLDVSPGPAAAFRASR